MNSQFLSVFPTAAVPTSFSDMIATKSHRMPNFETLLSLSQDMTLSTKRFALLNIWLSQAYSILCNINYSLPKTTDDVSSFLIIHILPMM